MLFNGYYTGTEGAGELLISATGKITAKFTNNKFSTNKTLYAKWILQHKKGARCKGKQYYIDSDPKKNDEKNKNYPISTYPYMYDAYCGTCKGGITIYAENNKLDKSKPYDIKNYGGQCPRYYCSECNKWIYYSSDWN